MKLDELKIPEVVKQEIEDFASEVERLNRGEVGEDDFKRFRLQQGIYGQRQEDVQMIRTKLPYGRVTADQAPDGCGVAERVPHGASAVGVVRGVARAHHRSSSQAGRRLA